MSKRLPVIGHNELRSHIGEGVHTGLRKGGDAPSAPDLWKAIGDSDDSAWSDAVDFCVYGLREMYPNGFEFDPDKPDTDPQFVMDVDSVVWVFSSRVRQVRGPLGERRVRPSRHQAPALGAQGRDDDSGHAPGRAWAGRQHRD